MKPLLSNNCDYWGPKVKCPRVIAVRLAGTLQSFAILGILEKYNGLSIISLKYFSHPAEQSISQVTF